MIITLPRCQELSLRSFAKRYHNQRTGPVNRKSAEYQNTFGSAILLVSTDVCIIAKLYLQNMLRFCWPHNEIPGGMLGAISQSFCFISPLFYIFTNVTHPLPMLYYPSLHWLYANLIASDRGTTIYPCLLSDRST